MPFVSASLWSLASDFSALKGLHSQGIEHTASSDDRCLKWSSRFHSLKPGYETQAKETVYPCDNNKKVPRTIYFPFFTMGNNGAWKLNTRSLMLSVESPDYSFTHPGSVCLPLLLYVLTVQYPSTSLWQKVKQNRTRDNFERFVVYAYTRQMLDTLLRVLVSRNEPIFVPCHDIASAFRDGPKPQGAETARVLMYCSIY